MSQTEKASRLAQLHQKGNPLVLYNIWDAGGAKAVEEAGAFSGNAICCFKDRRTAQLDAAVLLRRAFKAMRSALVH
ncbi:hypothetical protein ABID12_003691 [Martelella mangrovi]|uniref:Isocitrate lyase/phosphoenolpyruvate mutase family protein n=1 Tax=Martelella mangrovi TaxID=1397477 RepID=A0ABV2IFN0_9HYPH